jgi:XisH protein
MPTRDLYHDLVKNALRQDGWRITHNVLPLKVGAEIGAGELWTTQLLAADKDERKIAVAVNSFIGRSDPADLAQELGQLALSRSRLHAIKSDRVLYLAVRHATYSACFTGLDGVRLLDSQHMQLIVFDPRTETIVCWIP